MMLSPSAVITLSSTVFIALKRVWYREERGKRMSPRKQKVKKKTKPNNLQPALVTMEHALAKLPDLVNVQTGVDNADGAGSRGGGGGHG